MLAHSQIVFLETELRSTQDFFGISLHFQIPEDPRISSTKLPLRIQAIDCEHDVLQLQTICG